MMSILRYIIIITFSLLITNLSYSQNYTINSIPLPKDNGLTGNRIYRLLQDSNNFVWILTQNGVARFDGYKYKWFNKTNSELRDIPETKHIANDANGYIWFNHKNKIDLMHQTSFEVIHFEEKFKEIVKGKFICNTIIQGPNGSIIFSLKQNEKAQFFIYHPKEGVKPLNFLLKKYYSLNVKGNAIWQRSLSGDFIKYDLKTGKVLKQILRKNSESYGQTQLIRGNNSKDLFVGFQNKQLVILEAGKQNVKEVFRVEGIENTQINLIRNTIIYHQPTKKIILRIDDTSYTIDLKEKEINPINDFQNTDNRQFIKTLLIDNDGTIWSKVSGKEVSLFKIQPTNFSLYLSGKSVRGIWVNDQNLYTSKHKIPLSSPDNFTTFDLKSSHAIFSNQIDDLWISHKNGISNILAPNGILQPSIYLSKTIRSASSSRFWSIHQDKEGHWWGGTIGSLGLVTNRNQVSDSLYFYQKYNDFDDLKSSTVFQLLEEGNYIWAVTNTGLYYIHKDKGVIHHYALAAKKGFQLPLSKVHFLYKDNENVYWVATNTDGLIRFELNENKQIKRFKTYNIEDGLSSNILYAIIPDDKNRFWISTFNGLTLFDKKTEKIQAFLETDGLPITEFNRTSYTKGPDGRIYFGTIKGIISFFPDDIVKADKFQKSIHIIKFEKYRQKDNQLTDYTSEVQKNQKIVLEPNDRFFRMTISMMDYFNSEGIHYDYKIDGLFNDYQSITGNTIELGSLPYGQYKLILRGQGTDKRYSNNELIIPLIVKRPFYLRWWFMLLALCLIIFSIINIYNWRVKQLHAHQVKLRLLIAERTAKIREDKTVIEKQAQQLKELDKIKSKFFANISHELRTPLTLILAPLNNLFKVKNLSNKQFTQLLLMQKNGQKLLKRINELLDLSRLDANKLEVNEKPIFLYSFLKTSLSTFESAANLKDIQLAFDYPLDENLQLLLDEDKVEKIVTNYLSNALKFTPKGGVITLTVNKDGRKLTLNVADTGVGILPEDFSKVFDRFYQTAKTNQQQGTGIGLSLCKELAKIINGRVWLTSEIGKGSVFYLELPFIETFAMKPIDKIEQVIPRHETTEQPTQSHQSHIQNYIQKRPTILVVEDNIDLRDFLTIILEDKYNVVTAENGQEALWKLGIKSSDISGLLEQAEEKISNNPIIPNLIISDIMMPVLDGIQFITKVKSTDELRHLPVILLTARQNIDVKIEALRIGIDDYLTKPFVSEELIARIENLIQNSNHRSVQQPTFSSVKAENKVTNTDIKWLENVEAIILKNIENGDFTLNQLATDLFITPRTLQQKIKHITGKTPKQYQRDIQMHIARKKIKNGDVTTIAELGFQLGFEDPYYFAKLYKKHYGISLKDDMHQS